MRCRYCGSENPPAEVRCVKCQMRLTGTDTAFPGNRWHALESAVAPNYEPFAELDERPPERSPVMIYSNPDVKSRPPAVQPSLFAEQNARTVVGLEEYVGQQEPPRRARPQPRSAPRKKGVEGQAAFEFVPLTGPQRPFSREQTRRSDFEVAPLSFRTAATLFDAAVVAVFLGLFFATIRLALGSLPLGGAVGACYATSALLISAAYKLIWSICGRPTLGPQLAHLTLVSFDGHRPTTAQRVVRLFSAWLSVASAGMGVLWAPLDRDRLSWHDHISQTYYTPRHTGRSR